MLFGVVAALWDRRDYLPRSTSPYGWLWQLTIGCCIGYCVGKHLKRAVPAEEVAICSV